MQKLTFDSFCENFEQANVIGTYDLIKTDDNRVFAIEQRSNEVIELTASYKNCLDNRLVCLCQGIGGSWVAVFTESNQISR